MSKIRFIWLLTSKALAVPQTNLYESLYRQSQIPITKQATKFQAENLIRHLGHIYNTFGIVMKDLIRAVAGKFEPAPEVTPRPSTADQQEGTSQQRQRCINCCQGERERVQEKCERNDIAKSDKETQLKRVQKQRKVIVQSEKRGSQLDIKNAQNKEERLSVCSSHSQKQVPYLKEANQQSHTYFTQLLRDQLASQKNRSADQRPKKIQKMDIEFNKRDSKSKEFKGSSPIVVEQQQNLNANIRKQKDASLASKQSSKLQAPISRRFEQRLSQFEYNDNSNSVRFVPGRTKKEREQYPGIECKDCERYYKSMGLENPSICECSSRHRSSMPLRRFEKNNFTQQFDI